MQFIAEHVPYNYYGMMQFKTDEGKEIKFFTSNIVEKMIQDKLGGIETYTFKELKNTMLNWAKHFTFSYNTQSGESSWQFDNSFPDCYNLFDYTIELKSKEKGNQKSYWLLMNDIIFNIRLIGFKRNDSRTLDYSPEACYINSMYRLGQDTLNRLALMGNREFTEKEIEKLSKLKDTIEIK
jgi:hypothetical protein